MSKQQTLRRYALALALVADRDAAGDLFMDAADEADLWARANRLRQASGLEPIVDEPLELPALDDDQAEYALHLAARAAYRRRSRRTLTLFAGAVLLVGLLFAVKSLGGRVVPWVQWTVPLLGLFLLGAGSLLTARRADRGAWLLMVWGTLLLANTALTIFMNRMPITSATMDRYRNLSLAWSLVYQFTMWGTAIYVVWRLWPQRAPRRHLAATRSRSLS